MHMQIQPDAGKVGITSSPGTAQQTSPSQEAIQSEGPSVEQSVTSMQKSLDLMKETNFQVEFDRDIDRVVVKYTNTFGEVVRQVPTKDFVEFEKEFVRTIGLLFDKRA